MANLKVFKLVQKNKDASIERIFIFMQDEPEIGFEILFSDDDIIRSDLLGIYSSRL